jgi:hypothetical protein
MNLATVMAQLATQLDTIAGLRVHGSPPGTVVPPAAIVDYPDEITYDASYGRGCDRITLPVWVVIGRPTDRSTAALLAAYATGSGGSSVKQVVEAGSYTAFDSVRVARAEFDGVDIGGVVYIAGRFELDIIGEGAV